MLGAAHVMLNILALVLWLVSPLRFVPVRISEALGRRIQSDQNTAFSLLIWVVVIFFIVPAAIIYLT
jgi:hypothetical protein